VQRVLVTGPSKKNAAELMGRTECNRIVNFDGGPHAARLLGRMIDLHITEALPHSLRGRVAVDEPPALQPGAATDGPGVAVGLNRGPGRSPATTA